MTRKVYGPYTNKKNGRQIVKIVEDDGRTYVQTYPRFVMENRLGRKLDPSEHVDHIDNDPSNNSDDNFQILTPRENNIKAILFHGYSEKKSTYVCPICGISFERLDRFVKGNQATKGKRGPYCSRSCAGKAGRKG